MESLNLFLIIRIKSPNFFSQYCMESSNLIMLVTRYALLAVCRPFGAVFYSINERGLHRRLYSGSPSDFSFVRLLYVMAGFRFATRYIYHW